MGYNKAREERKWKKWKKDEENILRQEGMPESKIIELRQYDWRIFNSERRFREKQFTNNNLNDFIMALATRLNFSNERYHYLASHILLLEKQYKKVYNHLEYITIDERLGRYLPALYNFSPRLYNKYARMMYIPLNLAIM